MAEVKSDRPIVIKKYTGAQLIYLFFRRIVCFFSFGFIFPMSWAEDIDATAFDAQYLLESDKAKTTITVG